MSCMTASALGSSDAGALEGLPGTELAPPLQAAAEAACAAALREVAFCAAQNGTGGGAVGGTSGDIGADDGSEGDGDGKMLAKAGLRKTGSGVAVAGAAEKIPANLACEVNEASEAEGELGSQLISLPWVLGGKRRFLG